VKRQADQQLNPLTNDGQWIKRGQWMIEIELTDDQAEGQA
jgi:hypothetical protein